MSAVAPAPARRSSRTSSPRVEAAPARTRPVRVRRLSTSGLVWMGVLTLLLGGLVALNVAALRSTIAMTEVTTKVHKLQEQNRLDMATVANESKASVIAQKARSWGMRQNVPGARDTLSLKPDGSAGTAKAPGAPG
jgi:hypothetical protein